MRTFTMTTELNDCYYRKLSLAEKAIYRSARGALSRLDRTAEVPFKCDARALHNAVEALLADNPQFFFVNGRYTCRTSTGSFLLRQLSEITFDFGYDTGTVRRLQDRIDGIVARFPYENEAQFALSVHDYLVKTVKYDLRDGGISDARYFENHNLVGALIYNKSVCDGISKAFAYIMRSRNVQCALIRGTLLNGGMPQVENHGWNVVRLNGKNYHVDVTCDCTLSAADPAQPRRDYFCLPDAEIGKSHAFSERFGCDSMDENPFFKEHLVFDDMGSLIKYVRSLPYSTRRFAVKCNGLNGNDVHRNVMAALAEKRGALSLHMYPNETLGVFYFEVR